MRLPLNRGDERIVTNPVAILWPVKMHLTNHPCLYDVPDTPASYLVVHTGTRFRGVVGIISITHIREHAARARAMAYEWPERSTAPPHM